ncbi:hypothetical protein DY000_02027249 [Brassica cretica]|uniref:Uncharacterized protein n=1 Tax=Brassica cretica TaxID=69181 RepID=A0ABQ7EFZ7_BRACR|nr:hypothetical protein DY000_02027249 [Brassica cretica]
MFVTDPFNTVNDDYLRPTSTNGGLCVDQKHALEHIQSLILYSLISAEFPTYKIVFTARGSKMKQLQPLQNLNQSERTSSLAGGLRAPFPDLLSALYIL